MVDSEQIFETFEPCAMFVEFASVDGQFAEFILGHNFLEVGNGFESQFRVIVPNFHRRREFFEQKTQVQFGELGFVPVVDFLVLPLLLEPEHAVPEIRRVRVRNQFQHDFLEIDRHLRCFFCR